MNPEPLTCQKLTAGLLYPPIPLQAVNLNRLYAQISERYVYQNLTHLPDGIRIANPDGDCFVQAGRTQINEAVMHFPASKEKCIDIFRTVQEFLNIPSFVTFGIKLTAFLPFPEPGGASKFIEEHMLSVSPAQWELLGPGRKGPGIRVVLHQDGVHDLRIEPFYNDTSQLYVEIDVQHPEPFSSLDPVEGWMDAAYDYLFKNVKAFLGTL